MANEPVKSYRHILINQKGSIKLYTPQGRGPSRNLPPHERGSHSAKLLAQIQDIADIELSRREERIAFQASADSGICIAFESSPGFDLLFENLEFLKHGIELLSVKNINGRVEATCYVPEGMLEIFIKRIQAYAEINTRFNRPAYADLVNSINNIKVAALKELWTDENPLPDEDAEIWWEVWLRSNDPSQTLERIRSAASDLGIQVSDEYITFPERIIVQIFATSLTLTKSIEILNLVSEVRLGNRKPTNRFFPDRANAQLLLEDLLGRLEVAPRTNIGVAILDTGVNRLHPLLAPILNEENMYASVDAWLTSDHEGHGTAMAGLAAYGDMYGLQHGPVQIPYILESIKILPPVGSNAPHLYGKVTADGVRKCEESAPNRKRIFSKSITSDLHKRGEPSSYSAKIDDLASGASDNKKRLFIISAGNTSPDNWHNYPAHSISSGIEEPAQAWNALTVGASTNLIDLPNTAEYIGWSTVAPVGGLSPFSCTSITWHGSHWPFKPDVVWEGGNCATQPGANGATDHDSLSVLTTNWQPVNRLFTTSNMTSAATAQIAGLAGEIQSYYPSLWPETVRGMIVHAATWADAMKRHFPPTNKINKERLLRACGYGIPDFDFAIKSLSNNVVLITQDEIQPFQISKGKGKAKQLQIHNLPWPKQVLESLGEAEVKLKVTLSYFVEPNPAQRGWQSKFRYQSFGLRFDLRRKEETERSFEKRVTKLASEDDAAIPSPIQDSGWILGAQLRNKGSIHSDTWTGPAVDLATRDRIAIYPVLGWWRERLALGRCERKARYALIVSIQSASSDIDLYQEIQALVDVSIDAQVELDA